MKAVMLALWFVSVVVSGGISFWCGEWIGWQRGLMECDERQMRKIINAVAETSER